jgi:hypothetical protein
VSPASVARSVLAAAGALLMASSCGRTDARAAADDRQRAGAAAVLREASAARYEPPADGRLTEAQVRMYLAVREREWRLREAAANDAVRRREAAPADLRAAQELRANPKEYAWVRERVLEAEVAASTQALSQRMAAGREQLLAHKRRELEALSDEQQRAAVERDIEDWKRGLQGSEPTLPAPIKANVALLARFREPLARLRTLEERVLAASAGLDSGLTTSLGAAGH